MISLIIPTFGNLPRVAKLVRSIEQYEKQVNYELIVINDKPGIVNAKSGNLRVINNEKNLGFAGSINRGLEAGKGDILLLVNDDIVWTGPVLQKIEAEFKADPDLGILGALLKYPNRTIQHAGMIFDPKTKSFYHIKKSPKTQYIIAVTGAFFAISRKLYEANGGLDDDKFFLACEDTAYCLKAWCSGFKVKFSCEISAIHEEGATRGRTPAEKSKHREWTAKEQKGIALFKSYLNLDEIAAIQKKIRKLNGEGPLKIEVGSGYNPHPGYKHLDIRAGLPQLDYVCDFTKEALPFADGTVEEILANHVIEHIPFRLLPFVLKEWARVLEDGGKLVLRTPDLRFICEMYLVGRKTPEWPGDEKFITENLSKEVTPAWWANLKLFSGQDYAANFHHCCFDFEMLSQLLKRFGFGTVALRKFDREFSPGELQIEARKGGLYEEVIITGRPPFVKWLGKAKELQENAFKNYQFPKAYSQEVRYDSKAEALIDDWNQKLQTLKAPPKSCLIVRDGAMGDVLLTTPIIERLSKEYGIIDVCTKATEVFKYNPHVRKAFADFAENKTVPGHYDKVVVLNNVYELSPKMHIVDAYSLVAFGDKSTPLKTYLYKQPVVKENYIVIHAAKSWENRTWSRDYWKSLIEGLVHEDEQIVLIGSGDDYNFYKEVNHYKHLVGQQTFWQMVDTIAGAKLFIGMDSGPLHVAEAVGTPAIGIYTCAKFINRSTARGTTFAVEPEIDCYGCLHDEKPPVHYVGCRRGDFKCLNIISPQQVLKAYEQFQQSPTRGTLFIQDSNRP